MQSADRFQQLFTLFDISLKKLLKVLNIVIKASKFLVLLPYIATLYFERFSLQASCRRKIQEKLVNLKKII